MMHGALPDVRPGAIEAASVIDALRSIRIRGASDLHSHWVTVPTVRHNRSY